jgi:hypothetical protein
MARAGRAGIFSGHARAAAIRVVVVDPPGVDPQTDRMDPDWMDGGTFWGERNRVNHTPDRDRVDHPQTDRVVPDGMDGGHDRGCRMGRKTGPHQVDPNRMNHTPHRLGWHHHTPLRVVPSVVWVGVDPHEGVEHQRQCS